MLFAKNRKRDPFKKLDIAHLTIAERAEFNRRGRVPGEFLEELRSLLPYQAVMVDFSMFPEIEIPNRMRTYAEAVSCETRRRIKTFACERVGETLVAARF